MYDLYGSAHEQAGGERAGSDRAAAVREGWNKECLVIFSFINVVIFPSLFNY